MRVRGDGVSGRGREVPGAAHSCNVATEHRQLEGVGYFPGVLEQLVRLNEGGLEKMAPQCFTPSLDV